MTTPSLRLAAATHALAPWALIWLPLGFGWGRVHFAALRRAVACLLGGRSGALALLLARLSLSVVFLLPAARYGAAALLALFTGFLVARQLALRSAQQATAAPERA